MLATKQGADELLSRGVIGFCHPGKAPEKESAPLAVPRRDGEAIRVRQDKFTGLLPDQGNPRRIKKVTAKDRTILLDLTPTERYRIGQQPQRLEPGHPWRS